MCQRGGEGWGDVHSDDGMGVDDSVHVGNGSGICNSKRGGSMCVCGGVVAEDVGNSNGHDGGGRQYVETS